MGSYLLRRDGYDIIEILETCHCRTQMMRRPEDWIRCDGCDIIEILDTRHCRTQMMRRPEDWSRTYVSSKVPLTKELVSEVLPTARNPKTATFL